MRMKEQTEEERFLSQGVHKSQYPVGSFTWSAMINADQLKWGGKKIACLSNFGNGREALWRQRGQRKGKIDASPGGGGHRLAVCHLAGTNRK